MLTPENPAVLVRDFKSDETYIITRSDVIQALELNWSRERRAGDAVAEIDRVRAAVLRSRTEWQET